MGEAFFGSRGLTGNNDGVDPTTKYVLNADMVQLFNPSTKKALLALDPNEVIINIEAAGPVANGRDQAGAFSSNSWIHFYWIFNGTTIAGIASAEPPPTGPTLPSGYTHWSYATAVRLNGSDELLRMRTAQNVTWYEIAGGGITRVLSAGTAGTLTEIDLSALIPPNASFVDVAAIVAVTHSANIGFALNVVPSDAAAFPTGATRVDIQETGIANSARNYARVLVGPDSKIGYRFDSSATPDSGGGFIDIMGFGLPNGAS